MQMFRRCEACGDGITDYDMFVTCDCGAIFCFGCAADNTIVRPVEGEPRKRYTTCTVCEEDV